MCEEHLQWFGHVLRKEHVPIACSVQKLIVNGKSPRGKHKQQWQDTVESDLSVHQLHTDDAEKGNV